MMVVAAMLRVKDPCSEVGKVNSRDVPQALRYRIVSVLHFGLLQRWGLL